MILIYQLLIYLVISLIYYTLLISIYLYINKFISYMKSVKINDVESIIIKYLDEEKASPNFRRRYILKKLITKEIRGTGKFLVDISKNNKNYFLILKKVGIDEIIRELEEKTTYDISLKLHLMDGFNIVDYEFAVSNCKNLDMNVQITALEVLGNRGDYKSFIKGYKIVRSTNPFIDEKVIKEIVLKFKGNVNELYREISFGVED